MNKNILLLSLILFASTLFIGCITEKDTDNDGYADNVDAFPNDAKYHLDFDKDGYADEVDAFPNDTRYHLDSDNDSYADEEDAFPNDASYHSDYDGDGYADEIDEFPHDARYYSQVDKNIKMCEEVAQEYSKTHTYVENDVFDCDNMAQDVWNMLKTKGINSKLMLGNVELDKPVLTIKDVNHVWLLAEVSPNNWLPIETTGGYVVYDNDLYYRGYSFNNPKNYRSFLELYNDYLYQFADYENEVDYYNQLVELYNNADYNTQIQLISALTVTKNNVEIKERRASETFSKIEAILEYG